MTEANLDALDNQGRGASAGPLRRFTQIVAAVGTIWTFALMLLIVADVIGRSFLSRPITGVAEIAAHSIVGIVFLQLASAVEAGRMTRADFLLDRVQKSAPALARALEATFLLAGALVCVLIAYAGVRPLVGAWEAREFFGVQGVFTIPTWPVRALIVFGSTLAALVFLAQAIKQFRR